MRVTLAMRIRSRYRIVALFLLIVIAAAWASSNMDNIPAYIVIAPGYLVQAWLFERHLAPGGFGYQITMVGVSALIWTLIIVVLSAVARWFWRLLRPAS